MMAWGRLSPAIVVDGTQSGSGKGGGGVRVPVGFRGDNDG